MDFCFSLIAQIFNTYALSIYSSSIWKSFQNYVLSIESYMETSGNLLFFRLENHRYSPKWFENSNLGYIAIVNYHIPHSLAA